MSDLPKILGQQLTQDQMDKFDIWKDQSKSRLMIEGIETGFVGIMLLTIVYGGHIEWLQIPFLIVYICMMLLGLLGIAHMHKVQAGAVPVVSSRYLVYGSSAWDWPFGPRYRFHLFAGIAQSAAAVVVAAGAGWTGVSVLAFLVWVITHVMNYLRAKITLRLLK